MSEIGPYAKIGVYGYQGSGKTRFCATAPGVLLVDMNEQGTRSAASSAGKGVNITEWSEIADIYWYLKSGKHRYETVALDTLTGMQDLCMEFVMKSSRLSAPSKREYGQTGALMRGMIGAFRNLPMHVILTAQVRSIRSEDDDETIEGYTFDLPAGARGAALAAVSIIGYMEPKRLRVSAEGEKTRRAWVDHLVVERNELWYTKDRTYNMPPRLRRPTMATVLEAWTTPPKEQHVG